MPNDQIRRQFEQLSGQRVPESPFQRTSGYKVLLTLLFSAALFLITMAWTLDRTWFPIRSGQWVVCRQPMGAWTARQGPMLRNFCFGGASYFEQRRRLELDFNVQLSDGQNLALQGWLVYDLPAEPDRLLDIWIFAGSQVGFEERILLPNIHREVSRVFSQFRGNDLLPRRTRQLVSQIIGRLLEEELSRQWGLSVFTVTLSGETQITPPTPRLRRQKFGEPKEIPL